jgi:hypothetical protein
VEAETIAPSASSQCQELRTLLKASTTQREQDWNERVSRLVGLLAVDFATQSDPQIALCEVGLVDLAGQQGIKTAKTRVLSLARWNDTPPPRPAEGLLPLDELKAVTRVLSRIRSEWVLDYVNDALLVPVHKSLWRDLVIWALKTAPSLQVLFASLMKALDARDGRHVAGYRVIGLYLKQPALKLLPVGDGVLKTFVSFLPKNDQESMGKVEKAERAKLVGAVVELFELAVIQSPQMALLPEFQWALRQLRDAKRLQTSTKVRLVITMRAVANSLALAYRVADAPDRETVAKASMAIAEENEDYRRYVANIIAADESYRGLLTSEPGRVKPADDELESAIADLYAEVDDLQSSNPQDGAVAQVMRRVLSVGRAARIVPYGNNGERVQFDPLRHIAIESAAPAAGEVVIRRAGLVLKRKDASERVLLKAIVERKD